MIVGQSAFSAIFWFLYVYLIISCFFLTYNIIKRGFLTPKDKDKKNKS